MAETSPLRVFISYSHKDQRLLDGLRDHLAQLQREQLVQHWSDRKIQAGDDWAGQIDQNLEAANIILLLVSASFLNSNYCSDIEVRRAMDRHQKGEARLIPIILKPSDWTHTEFARLQALPDGGRPITKWSNRDEAYLSVVQGIREVAADVAASIAAEPAGQAPEKAPPLELPQGPVRQDSPFYLHPPQEQSCFEEIAKPGALIRLKSPQGFGKSSLMARIVAHACSCGARTASLDLLSVNQANFDNPTRFLQWFCAATGKQLGVRVATQEYWDDIFGANDNASDYVETYLLQPQPSPLVLAIDNFDRVFAHAAIETDFCGLLRSWHEQSRSKPLWERFRLIIAHSQEPYLQKDINQSPFNVGLPVELGELSKEQVRHLAASHALDLSDGGLEQLAELVGGHPLLVRKALYALAQGLPLAEFMRTASTEAGIYSDHLPGLLKAVQDANLSEALTTVMTADTPVMLRSEQAFKLDSLGLVVPINNQVKPRCLLYRQYFLDRLRS